MTKKDKYRQVQREAIATGIVLVLLILFWLASGFGLAGSDIRIFHLPLWAMMGSIGVWFMAIFLVRILTKLVFRDMPLSGEEERHE